MIELTRADSPRRWLRFAGAALFYIVAYVVLDEISFIPPFAQVGITPFDPSGGFTLAWLLRKGLHFGPVVPIAVFVSDIAVRDMAHPWLPTLLSALNAAAGYIAAASVLRWLIGGEPGLIRLGGILQLIMVAFVATLVVAAIDVLLFVRFGLISHAELWSAVLRSWVGDLIGALTLTPALLIVSDPERWRRPEDWPLGPPSRLPETIVQAGTVLLAVFAVFSLEAADRFKYFYLLFVPIIWLAVRRGLPGAAMGLLVTEIALVVAIKRYDHDAETMIVFQMLMVVLGLTGLILGAIVSERQQSNRALKENEARLAAILGTAPDGILTIDAEGIVELANPAAETMFGHQASGLAGKPVAALLPELILGGGGGSRELHGVGAEGTSFPAEVSVGETLIGRHQLFIAVVRDVTLRTKAEAWVRQHQMDVAHSDRVSMIGEMASAIAHEVSQPLTAIAAYTRGCRLLFDTPGVDRERIRASLEKIGVQATRAGAVLTRLREFLHRDEMHPVPTSAADIVNEVAELARTDITERGIRLDIDIPPDLPKVMVDRIHIEQVLLNLVRNGADAIAEVPSAEPAISIAARKVDGRIEFEVGDSGPGVDPVITEQLFQPFITTKGKGMGLGLSISRTLVEAYGGQLRHVPRSNTGALFRFDLPLTDEQAG
ncbi:MAG: PAS domain S-box protein [Azospirillum sp.]|nr:PAS domain S-box protein [Azospirillum sp.]